LTFCFSSIGDAFLVERKTRPERKHDINEPNPNAPGEPHPVENHKKKEHAIRE
jgi:hypothetical protein